MQHEFGGNAAVLTLEARSLRRSVTDYRLLQSQQVKVTSLNKLTVSILRIMDA